MKKKGIFCVEGEWFNNLAKPSSMESALVLLKTPLVSGIPYIHRNVATRTELEHYFNLWTKKRYDAYPLLYLGLHGKQGTIYCGDGRDRKSSIDLKEVRDRLEKASIKNRRRILHFSSCGTLNIHGNEARGFLRATGLNAVLGYQESFVDWMDSAIFEIALLHRVLSLSSFTSNRLTRALVDTKKNQPVLWKKLGFAAAVADGENATIVK